MEEKIQKVLSDCIATLGEDTDVMIVAHRKGKCGAVVSGEAEDVAKAIFAIIHQSGSPVAQKLYQILKLDAMNIAANESPYSVDFTKAVYQSIPESDE